MNSLALGEYGYTFWVVDQQTRVDTDQLLAANVFLRGAVEDLGLAAMAAAAALSAVQVAVEADIDPQITAMEESLTAAHQTLQLVLDQLVLLLFWRERAAQIYEVAEQSVSGFFSSCQVAEYATCGQDAGIWQYRLAGVPGVGSLLLGVTALQSLSAYRGVLDGTAAGSGAESLQMQIQTQRVAGTLSERLGRLGLLPEQNGPVGKLYATGVMAGTAAGVFRGIRRESGNDSNGVMIVGKTDGCASPVFAVTARDSGQLQLYPNPLRNSGWHKATAIAGAIAGRQAAAGDRAAGTCADFPCGPGNPPHQRVGAVHLPPRRGEVVYRRTAARTEDAGGHPRGCAVPRHRAAAPVRQYHPGRR